MNKEIKETLQLVRDKILTRDEAGQRLLEICEKYDSTTNHSNNYTRNP